MNREIVEETRDASFSDFSLYIPACRQEQIEPILRTRALNISQMTLFRQFLQIPNTTMRQAALIHTDDGLELNTQF
ncbi:hypothetical protein KSF_106440 [Reticulibacter mediterranei]|uniref:Uncharacterized protein n=1 Tax=Reticulibacter mediterranei TaxID=2778369 RepID=A0A8J3J4K6_9CHLR|nr:hypothetical protein [Reticulibacter mediterranei]GHP00597.1 hypothetical protein KSF_106440 [Reticulibacter mediterranei]